MSWFDRREPKPLVSDDRYVDANTPASTSRSPPPLKSVTICLMRDRRFELRHVTNQPVELRWTGADGSDQGCAGTMRDFSRSGARIELDRPVPVQTAVQVALGEQKLGTRIASCVRAKAAYLVGVEFDPEFQGVIKKSNKTADR
jgi:hypothetical protein